MSHDATDAPRPWDAWQPGIRVVVRRRLPDGMLGDVLGDLLSVDPTHLVVRTRTGDVVVHRGDVVAGKPVPPPPPRRPRRVPEEPPGRPTAD